MDTQDAQFKVSEGKWRQAVKKERKNTVAEKDNLSQVTCDKSNQMIRVMDEGTGGQS